MEIIKIRTVINELNQHTVDWRKNRSWFIGECNERAKLMSYTNKVGRHAYFGNKKRIQHHYMVADTKR